MPRGRKGSAGGAPGSSRLALRDKGYSRADITQPEETDALNKINISGTPYSGRGPRAPTLNLWLRLRLSDPRDISPKYLPVIYHTLSG